ncbi:MAG: aminotransferase class I/II-fold pyridoxal phosphate-dependent enzyme [Deltaproteobacteria bacterium]|nr:aminotransferase class I/II-fold pyridoxal phosphate-dependent enzyme [Deltaproteobacteria bacterium]
MNLEDALTQRLLALKAQAGSHPTSLTRLRDGLPGLRVAVDACFLANPYAAELAVDTLREAVQSREAFRRAVEWYPAQETDLARLAAPLLGVAPEQLFLANGATEVIRAVLANLPPGPVVVTLPTFSPFYEFLPPQAPPLFYTLPKAQGFRLELEPYLAFLQQERPRAVIWVNPNNPDGGWLAPQELAWLLARLPDSVERVVLDESFDHFAQPPGASEIPEESLAGSAWLPGKDPRVVVVKSLSKDFGVAGLRLGYGVMSAALAGQTRRHHLWNINGLAEVFLRAWVGEDFQRRYRKALHRYRGDLGVFFQGLGALENTGQVRVFPSRGNFALVELLGHTADQVFTRLLARHGVYVRHCGDKRGLNGEFLRISARTAPENTQVTQALEDVLTGRQTEQVKQD